LEYLITQNYNTLPLLDISYEKSQKYLIGGVSPKFIVVSHLPHQCHVKRWLMHALSLVLWFFNIYFDRKASIN